MRPGGVNNPLSNNPLSLPEPDYGHSFADVYDKWYANVSDAAATARYINAIATGTTSRNVLELGVGSGRVALPIARKGLAVTGVDSSQAMLDLLAAKADSSTVRSLLGDMAVVDELVEQHLGNQHFGVVVVTFNTLFNLASAERQLRCLRGVARVLADDGSFVVEAFVPDVLGSDTPGSSVPRSESMLRRELSPTRVTRDSLVLSATEHDLVKQTVLGQHVEITEAGIRLRPWEIRYMTPTQLDEMAAKAGLTLAERHAGWAGEPFTADSGVHVSRYVLAD